MKLKPLALDFLNKHRICVIATLMKDGSPHAATVHYAANAKGDVYIMTEKTGRKSEALLNGNAGKTSFVTGFSDEEWITLQMEGEVKVVSGKKELEEVYKVYFAKNPGPEKYKDAPGTIFLKFTPSWYRYTEYKPKFKVISSEK